MLLRKRFFLYFIVLTFLVSSGYCQPQLGGYPDFELVESIPVETELDNPNIRNTPEVWLEMFKNAKKSLDIEQFYICNAPNEPLEEIIQALIDAGKRRVKVRIISESKFYKTYPETLDRLKKEKNISVRIIDFGKLAGGIMHAKYFIVDTRQVFLGSQNFDWKALKHIHEIGLKITNPACAKIFSDVFELDWQLAEKNDPSLIKKFLVKKQYPVPIRLIEPSNQMVEFTPVYSPTGLIPDESLWDEKKIIELIDTAKQEVVMQVLTYNPSVKGGGYYAELDTALRRAAARKVNVKLIISDWAKRKPQIDYLKSLAVIPNIEVKLSTIPQWSGGYVSYARVDHSKYLVVDSTKSWVGTSNWEKGYFYDSRNVGVIVNNNLISSLLEQIFMKSWDGPYTYFVKPDEEYIPPKIGE
ncbi:MAG: phospholipase D-like domain-containing protein [bacterium]|nr:phospholipase D-like domain-containing protein [bacterium]